MKQIVIAVDGSPEAWFATDVGLELAKGSGASVTFVHASTEIREGLMARDPTLVNRQDDLTAADGVLGEATDRARAVGVDARVELAPENGSDGIAREILALAVELEADLVVTGSRGRGAVVRSVLGSVSRVVLRDATVPALVVKVPRARD